MKKFLVISGVIFAAVIFAAFGPADGRGWIYQNLPAVEMEGSITEVGFISGRFYIKVTTNGDEYYAMLPLMVVRYEGISLKTGDSVKISGKTIETNIGKVVIVEKLYLGDKEYDVIKIMKEIRAKMRAKINKAIRNRMERYMKRNPNMQNWRRPFSAPPMLPQTGR